MDHPLAYPFGLRVLTDEVLAISATVRHRAAAAIQQAAWEARRRAVLAQRRPSGHELLPSRHP
jgi:hypothetical protein